MLFEAGGATLSAGMHLLGVDAAARAEPEGQGVGQRDRRDDGQRHDEGRFTPARHVVENVRGASDPAYWVQGNFSCR